MKDSAFRCYNNGKIKDIQPNGGTLKKGFSEKAKKPLMAPHLPFNMKVTQEP